MKLRITTLLLILGFVIAIPATHAEESSKKEKTELEKTMYVMSKANRQLKKQISDESKNASSLELVAKIRDSAEAAVKLIPAKAKDLHEGERAEFTAKYEASMKAFLETVTKLENDLKANDNDSAKKDLAKLGSEQKEGHKNFRKEEE